MRIPWTARRTNVSVWKQLNAEPILEYKIRSQRVAYFGHVARRRSLKHTALLGIGGERRKRTCPRQGGICARDQWGGIIT